MRSQPILLVEDNPDDEELTVHAIRELGIRNRIDVVRDGAEAISFLQSFDSATADRNALPGLILLDLKLPKLGGLAVLRAIRSKPETEFIPVIVLTSSSESNEMAECYRLRANSFIRKPVDHSRFLETVRDIGHYWLRTNQVPGGDPMPPASAQDHPV